MCDLGVVSQHAAAMVEDMSQLTLWMTVLFQPPLWSRLKYLNKCSVYFHEVLYRHSWFPVNESYWLWWSCDSSSSTTMRLTVVVKWTVSAAVGWIVMKCGSDVHVPLKMNCKNFGDPLTFHLAPQSWLKGHLLSCFLFQSLWPKSWDCFVDCCFQEAHRECG